MKPARKMIEFRGVVKRYGKDTVVNNVDFSVHEGERFALLGHNGAGKTTLIKMALGVCRPTSGEILLQGRSVALAAEQGRHIGYLPENVSFQTSMTGSEVIRFYASLKRRGKKECDALMERVGLTDVANHRVHTYSKGMRQRLGLAQAMLGTPTLMLLDEPTTGLDPELRTLFYDIINQHAAAGSTALINSHALSEIEANVDRVAILKNGSLVASGTLEELRRRAGLPTRIRVHTPSGRAQLVAEGLKGKVTVDRVNDQTIDLGCLDSEKLDTLKHIGNLDDSVIDFDIHPVNLEQIYAYYASEQDVDR